MKKIIRFNLICNLISFFLIVTLNVILFLNYNKTNHNLDVKKNNKNANKSGEIYVFLGDSITYGFKINELYESKAKIINSGENGNKVENIIRRLEDDVYPYKPTKVFVLAGINNLNNERNDTDELSEEIKNLIKKIENNTNAKIYLESIYPVNNSVEIDNNRTFYRNNKDIIAVNKKLKEFCENDNNVTYINVFDELVDKNGNLKMKYTTDGLHLTTLGYIKVIKVLEKYL